METLLVHMKTLWWPIPCDESSRGLTACSGVCLVACPEVSARAGGYVTDARDDVKCRDEGKPEVTVRIAPESAKWHAPECLTHLSNCMSPPEDSQLARGELPRGVLRGNVPSGRGAYVTPSRDDVNIRG